MDCHRNLAKLRSEDQSRHQSRLHREGVGQILTAVPCIFGEKLPRSVDVSCSLHTCSLLENVVEEPSGNNSYSGFFEQFSVESVESFACFAFR